jgi:hypothetical protein
MTPTPEAPPVDAVPPLPRDVVHRVVLYFAGHLPAPPGDTADDRARRDSDALADVAALEPANAAEVTQAMRCVAAGIWADDQLRLARLHSEDFVRTQQILRQHAHMLRTADGARALLLRVQTARQRREKDSAGSERDAALARGLLAALMQERAAQTGPIEADVAKVAAAKAAVAAAKVVAEAAEAEAAAAEAARLAAAAEPPPPLTEEEQRLEKWAIAADRFATIFPMRTRLIRRFGKLPDDCGIEQPEPELLEAIRIGTKYSLRWADELTKAQVYVEAGKDRHLCKYEDEYEDGAVVAEPVDPG